MSGAETGLNPPQRLALAYARADLRAPFAVLLEIDARLADVVARTREPIIGQMKLAWWRDAVAAPPGERPKGEPLIARLNDCQADRLQNGIVALIDAWEHLLVDGNTKLFAEQRGTAVFSTYARWVSAREDMAALGTAWALASTGVSSDLNQSLPRTRSLRPLTILALSARQPSGARLIWHALTGR